MVYSPYQNYQSPFQNPMQYPTYLPQTAMQQSQANNSSNGITWVQGEAGAKAYPVAAGTSMLLMDSETENFYIKSTDASGMPQPLRKFEYKEILENPKQEIPPVAQSFDSSQFVTRDEFERRIGELNRRAARTLDYNNKKKEELKNE